MVRYYVIQVKTRGEEKYKDLVERTFKTSGLDMAETGRLIWPKRELKIRRKGKTIISLAPIFPGYLFFEAENLENTTYRVLKKQAGFLRFLRNNHDIEPLSGEDERTLLQFLSCGDVVGQSLVFFDENQKIRVISGPMKGLEGRIIKVDKRKKRAKIKLSLYEDAFPVDFGFELLTSSEKTSD